MLSAILPIMYGGGIIINRFTKRIFIRQRFAKFEYIFRKAKKNRYFKEFKQQYYELSYELGVRTYLLDEYIYGAVTLLNSGTSPKPDLDLHRLIYEYLGEAVGGKDKLFRISANILALYHSSLPYPGAVLPIEAP